MLILVNAVDYGKINRSMKDQWKTSILVWKITAVAAVVKYIHRVVVQNLDISRQL